MSAIDQLLAKIASEETVSVKGHTRRVGGKVVQVRPHDREVDGPTPEEKAKELKSKKQREIEMWNSWNAGGRKPKDLRPLLKSMEPIIQSRASQYKGNVRYLSDAAIDAEFKKQAMAALRNYDPSKGAALGTYVYQYLEKAKRFISQNQNIARIPENRIWNIGEFQRAEAALEEELGRPAKDVEMAGYLKWPIKEVARMSKELSRGDLWTSKFEEDPTAITSSRDWETLKLLRFELTDDEKKIHDLLVKDNYSPSYIADKTGFNAFKVSRIKKSIAKKMEKYR